MKNYLLKGVVSLFVCIGFTTLMSAQNVITAEAGAEAIGDAMLEAFPGDIIELTTSGGVYTDSVTIDILQDVTIRAAAGLAEKPIIDGGGEDIFNVNSGGLNLSGVKLINANYAIYIKNVDAVNSTDFSLRVDNCEIIGWGSRGIYSSGSTAVPLDSLLITNTIFKDGIKQGMYLVRTAGTENIMGCFKYCLLDNCLFTGIIEGSDGNGHPTYIEPGDRENPESLPTLIMNHITVDSCFNALTAYCYPGSIIKNSVVSNITGADKYAIYNKPAYYVGSPANTVENCIYSHGGLYEGDDNATNIFINVDSVTAQYVDAANGDYTLVAGTAGVGAATDGTDLGYIAPKDNTSAKQFKYNYSVRAYPNPATESLYVTVGREASIASSLEIFDITGKLVIRMNDLNGQKNIHVDLTSVTPGLYFGILNSDAGNESFKFIKK